MTPETREDNALRECPHCGGPAREIEHHGGDRVTVWCGPYCHRGFEGPAAHRDELRTFWNRRAKEGADR
jgi:hypothetical protein